ncbi:PP2C family protein-serine/threonine phosphatase [Actinacidiphila sp. ITFR-21]|uniref:PP2C family protein-serine/threonine phosphatase n=1 Tax=Actinacidiphila sp. ITFR-21 TaxID=3075199 RepID=UPI00288B9A0E|nr:fused response regulator/phosphatase [Streptomyces sp. ITFR-21]WNI14389.1 fused response regulator/phosphatase [Streptomyces sp. ITFR-21]
MSDSDTAETPALTAVSYRILLIEDDPGDALLVEEYLADSSLNVDLQWAQTLADGMAGVGRRAPDCVLLDLHLPDASGTGAVARIQSACPAAAVIVLTGLADAGAGVEAVAAGAQDYLVKGTVTGELLDRAVRYAVHRKHAERTAAELRANQHRAQENSRLERSLLPVPMLSATAGVTPTSCYLPGREGALLAGDFLDVVETADGTVHAVIGDVSGHGPDEAGIGVCLRIAWRTLILGGHRGSGLLALMEQILVAERTYSAMFATVATLSLAPAGRLDITRAGHDTPLIVEGRTARPLPAPAGVALGLIPGGSAWHTAHLELPPAATLLLYTDGLTEGHVGPGRERLGTEGLISVIAAAPDPAGQALIDHLTTVTRELDAGRHLDDVAILLLTRDI